MGYYQFSLLLMSDGVKGNVELLYRRSVYPSGETEDKGAVMMSRSSCMVEQRWKTEQINDFVLKLGFLDVEDEMGAKIDHFLYLNHVRYIVTKTYTYVYVYIVIRTYSLMHGCRDGTGYT